MQLNLIQPFGEVFQSVMTRVSSLSLINIDVLTALAKHHADYLTVSAGLAGNLFNIENTGAGQFSTIRNLSLEAVNAARGGYDILSQARPRYDEWAIESAALAGDFVNPKRRQEMDKSKT